MIAEAIHARIIEDATITAALATWDFGDGAAPAVFTSDPIPVGCGHPAILITEVGGDNWDTFKHRGGNFQADVKIYGDKTFSRKVLRNLAELLWVRLHLANLTITGYDDWGTYCNMPAELTDPDGFPGFLLAVRTRVLSP